ncbi:ras guanine nucleotide exchange factor domain-containing protein [Chytriomyces cf. hyalinus JEL632]|nr:ras guanine nucleotide exchange factor domain-containing protein [Chytriomyces cf. hyalinus JEL632]
MHHNIILATLEFGNDHKDGLSEVLDVLTHSVHLLETASHDFSIAQLKLAFETAGACIAHILKLVSVVSEALQGYASVTQNSDYVFHELQMLDIRRNWAKLQIDFSKVCVDFMKDGSVVFSSITLKERVARVKRLVLMLWQSFCKFLDSQKENSNAGFEGHQNQPVIVPQMLTLMASHGKQIQNAATTSEMFQLASRMMHMYDEVCSSPARKSLEHAESTGFLIEIGLQELACSLIATSCGVDDLDALKHTVTELVLAVEEWQTLLGKHTYRPPLRGQSLRAGKASLDHLAARYHVDELRSSIADLGKGEGSNRDIRATSTFVPADVYKALVSYSDRAAAAALNETSVTYSTLRTDSPTTQQAPKIMTATLHTLIDCITRWNPTDDDLELRQTVLKTNASFCTPIELLDALITHFKNMVHFPQDLPSSLLDAYALHVVEGTRLSILRFLMDWLESDYKHVTEISATRAVLVDFLQFCNVTLVSRDELEAVDAVAMLLEKKPSKLRPSLRALEPALSKTNPVANGKHSRKQVALLQVDPLRIAQQLAYIDADIYDHITPSEMMNAEASAKDNSTHFAALLQRFNFVVGLVSTAVITHESPKMRALMISHFIQVAQHSLDMRSINAACAITTCLNSSSIHRLTNTWTKIQAPSMQMFASLKAVFDHRANFKYLRTLLASFDASSTLSCVPWLGFFAHDVIAVKEVHEAWIDGRVNVARLRALAKVVDAAFKFQNTATQSVRVVDAELWDVLTVKAGLLITQSRQYAASLNVERRKVGR